MECARLSSVKRDKLKKEERAQLRKKMRADLPILTREQVRRYHLPLHEAIFIELDDQGLFNTAQFLKDLIQFQENMRKVSGPDSELWSKPRLIRSPKTLDLLNNALKNSEAAHFSGALESECDELLAIAVHFITESNDWNWLVEQLMYQCINACSVYDGDEGRREATSRYIFGKFLLENVKDRNRAIDQLQVAETLSRGKYWTATKVLNCVQKTIFTECCLLLRKSLIEKAKDMMTSDLFSAIDICMQARKKAFDACDHSGEADALLLQGQCEMAIGNINTAAQTFYKVLLLRTKEKQIEGVCEARIALVQVYLKLENWVQTQANLEQLLEVAQTYNLPYYIGQHYRYMGEYHLNHGNPHLSTPLLVKALKVFHDIEDVSNREHAKNLAAISAGQELMAKYINMVVNSSLDDKTSCAYLQKLVKWKNIRDISWTMKDGSLTNSSFEDALIRVGESGSNLESVLSILQESPRRSLVKN